MKLFRISRVYWEEYEPYDLIGPNECSKEDFQNLCDSLLHSAAEAAIKVEETSERPSYVGWSDIVTQLVIQLVNHGFTLVEPIEVQYSGSAIIRANSAHGAQLPDSIIKEVVEFNNKVQKRVYQ